jgi:hypothetical protein
MKRYNSLLISFALLVVQISFAQSKPKVWIYSDMSDKSIPGKNHMNTVNDPDDISAMAGYLLMANEFDTKAIVIASTHRNEHKASANQADWANSYFGSAYKQEVKKLNKQIGGFPKKIEFTESCIKATAEKYETGKLYKSLTNYSTVESLYQLLLKEKDTINVLCWGTVTEPAILVNYCIGLGRIDLLKKMKFIAHWTNSPLHQGTPEHPEHVANCREDAAACAYMKEQAFKRIIQYYELGAIGQHGIVSGAPKGEDYYNQFKSSALGKIFVEGKFVQNCVDHSDAATYWALLKNWGVALTDVKPDGTNNATIEKMNEDKFKMWSIAIHDELLRRCKL